MKQKKYYIVWTLVMTIIITGVIILPVKRSINPEKWKGVITTTFIENTDIPFKGLDIVAERSENVLTLAKNSAVISYSKNSSIDYDGNNFCLQRVYIKNESLDFIFVDNTLVLLITDKIRESDKPLYWNDGFPPHKNRLLHMYPELIKNLK